MTFRRKTAGLVLAECVPQTIHFGALSTRGDRGKVRAPEKRKLTILYSSQITVFLLNYRLEVLQILAQFFDFR